ncbi:MAG: ATP-binding protein [candidate division Zixibacteria bacterium]|nr:ATP-binding protein [candidate division Zixibacteria bacterium]
MNQVKLSFKAVSGDFDEFYQSVYEMADRLKLSGTERFRFVLCISEAFTNAFVHGNKQDPSKVINVNFRWDESTVQVDIEDEGAGKADQIDLEHATAVAADQTGGRGIGFLKEYADRIKVEPRDEGGLRMSIYWKLGDNIPISGNQASA